MPTGIARKTRPATADGPARSSPLLQTHRAVPAGRPPGRSAPLAVIDPRHCRSRDGIAARAARATPPLATAVCRSDNQGTKPLQRAATLAAPPRGLRRYRQPINQFSSASGVAGCDPLRLYRPNRPAISCAAERAAKEPLQVVDQALFVVRKDSTFQPLQLNPPLQAANEPLRPARELIPNRCLKSENASNTSHRQLLPAAKRKMTWSSCCVCRRAPPPAIRLAAERCSNTASAASPPPPQETSDTGSGPAKSHPTVNTSAVSGCASRFPHAITAATSFQLRPIRVLTPRPPKCRSTSLAGGCMTNRALACTKTFRTVRYITHFSAERCAKTCSLTTVSTLALLLSSSTRVNPCFACRCGPKRSPLRTSSRPSARGAAYQSARFSFIVVADTTGAAEDWIGIQTVTYSRGEPSVSSNHFVKSMSLTSSDTNIRDRHLTALSPGEFRDLFVAARQGATLHKMQRQ